MRTRHAVALVGVVLLAGCEAQFQEPATGPSTQAVLSTAGGGVTAHGTPPSPCPVCAMSPTTFTRRDGQTKPHVREFVADPSLDYLLVVQDDGQESTRAEIKLNGETVVARRALYGGAVSELQVPLQLSPTNRLTVLPEGGAGSSVTVWILGGARVGPGGGTVQLAGGQVALSVPPGALGAAVLITAAAATLPPGGRTVVPGTAWDFGPDGLVFAQPATMTVRYDPTQLPPGVAAAGLRIHKLVNGTYVEQNAGVVDLVNQTVSAQVDGFSVYVLLPLVRLVTFSWPLNFQSHVGSSHAAIARVVDFSGNGVPNLTVQFAPAAGSVNTSSAVSDASGFAWASWTLGSALGFQRLTASVAGALQSARFDVAAYAVPRALPSYPLLTDLLDATGSHGPVGLFGNPTPPAAPTPAAPLCQNGLYAASPGGQDVQTPWLPAFELGTFRVSVDFRLSGYGITGKGAPIIIGSVGWRFIGLEVEPTGQVTLLWNNHIRAATSATVNLNQWHTGEIRFANGTADVLIDGQPVLTQNTGPLIAPPAVYAFTTNNYSNARAHYGCIRNLTIH